MCHFDVHEVYLSTAELQFNLIYMISVAWFCTYGKWFAADLKLFVVKSV